jgi:hypothetical protein
MAYLQTKKTIWDNFREPCKWKCWYIYDHLDYFMDNW